MSVDEVGTAGGPARSAICIAVLGLGEAGSEIARDLLAAGVQVRGYDPAVRASGDVVQCADEADAVNGADVVLSVNSAADAMTALRNGAPALAPHAVWADLNTSAATLKASLADELARRGGVFVDVALMSVVPGRGLRTPMVAAGPGAERYAEVMTPLGAQLEVLAGEPGAAATRKLLRSVFWKGMAASVVEALAAARAAGQEEWLRGVIGDELARFTAGSVDQIEQGSYQHAVRRSHEMAAATELLTDLGVPARVSAAARDQLADIAPAGS